MRAKRQPIRLFTDSREGGASEQLNWNHILELRQLELDRLRKPGKIRDHDNVFFPIAPYESQNFPVFRLKKLKRTSSERLVAFAQSEGLLHPPEQRIGITHLRFHVHSFVVVLGIQN